MNEALGFDHIHLISRDPKAAADWYREMFGGEVTAVQYPLPSEQEEVSADKKKRHSAKAWRDQCLIRRLARADQDWTRELTDCERPCQPRHEPGGRAFCDSSRFL